MCKREGSKLYTGMEWLTCAGERAEHNQSKGGEEGQEEEVDEEVSKVDVLYVGRPLVVQEAGDQWVLQETNLLTFNLSRGEWEHL